MILTEGERGCGYRSPGKKGVGLYLMGDAEFALCERLPFPLTVCPCCSSGIKFARGWTTITPAKLFEPRLKPACTNAEDCKWCVFCRPPTGQHGLIWIGAQYYSTKAFRREARAVGVSRKLSAVPNNLVLGETWVYLAHKKAVLNGTPVLGNGKPRLEPGVFMIFKPTHIDLVVDNHEDPPDKALKILDKLGDKARLVTVNPAPTVQQSGMQLAKE